MSEHTTNGQPLLEVKNLKKHFPIRRGFLSKVVGHVKAVDGVSFSVRDGETLGLVGESGCGKSITARSILRLVQHPGRIVNGEILFHRPINRDGNGEVAEVVDLTKLDPRGREMRNIRGGEISMVFQEPMSSLSPVYTVGNQLMEAIILHQQVSKKEAREKAIDMLRRVGLPQPSRTVDRYPYQLSGGMRQRVMIAIALSCNPALLIADEPTTALDVTTEAQILQLMRNLQHELGMATQFITHNLGVVAQMTEEVIVMYMGKVVERADVDTIFYDPKHPYTQALLQSIPRLGRESREPLATIPGSVPDPYAIPSGCPFRTRCPSFMPGVCDENKPILTDIGGGHMVSCFLYDIEGTEPHEPQRVS